MRIRHKLYTSKHGKSSNPAWSPDGTQIALLDGLDLVILNVTDASPTRHPLRNTPTMPFHLSWSPTESVGVFEGQTQQALYMLRLGGFEPWLCTSGRMPSWAPTGDRIAFYRDSRLRLGSPYGPFVQRGPETPGGADPPSWSPTGDRLVFPDEGHRITIAHANHDDAGRVAPSEWYGWGQTAVWSPREDLIAVGQHADIPRIFLLRLDGAMMAQYDYLSDPRWSSDGNLLLARPGHPPASSGPIVIIDIRTSERVELTEEGGGYWWSPTNPHVCWYEGDSFYLAEIVT